MTFTVALIGPDGAGKTTVARQLERALPLPAKYIYMGVNSGASNHLLPTTRLARRIKRLCGARPDTAGPRDPDRPRVPRPLWKRVLRGPWSVLSLANRLAEEWYRQLVASVYARRGFVVLFDRHYYADFHAYDIAGAGRPKPLKQRLHGWLLERFYPRPDLVILLDAPAEVLLARKGEGTLALLERRRQDYLRLREFVPRFVVVDATQPADAVLEDVVRRITEFHELQCRTHAPVRNGAA